MVVNTPVKAAAQDTNDKFSHGKQNLKLIEVNYRRNIASDYTDQMDKLKESFSYEANRNHHWVRPEFSLLYGSRFYESASESQKLALNHLYWICFYNYSIGGEVATMMFNQLTCGAFYHLGGYETVCRELDVETSQERSHVDAFRQIGNATEIALMGKTIFERPIPSFADSALVHPQAGQSGLVKRAVPKLYYNRMSTSPFVASQYYTVRGLRNIQLKVKEYQHSQYCQELEASQAFVPAPTAVSHFHYLDEAFHTATSQLISHELYKDFGAPNNYDTIMANMGVLVVQRTVNTLSASVPGIFSDDKFYMPLIYKMLQTPLFGLSAADALHVVEESFCQEHEGFHVAAKYHQRALSDNLKYVEGLNHLWPVNRELMVMRTASMQKSLKNNISTFKRFSQDVKQS
jgi:hypothetical protein